MTTEIRTFLDWLFDTLDHDQRLDLAQHGADTGWHGLTYTKDCALLFDQFEAEIWETLVNDSEDFGYQNVAEFIASFRRSDMLSSFDTFKNLLVWYMAERICRDNEDG